MHNGDIRHGVMQCGWLDTLGREISFVKGKGNVSIYVLPLFGIISSESFLTIFEIIKHILFIALSLPMHVLFFLCLLISCMSNYWWMH
jgi:hypothetical protein